MANYVIHSQHYTYRHNQRAHLRFYQTGQPPARFGYALQPAINLPYVSATEFNKTIDTYVENNADIQLSPDLLYKKVEDLVSQLAIFDKPKPHPEKSTLCQYKISQHCLKHNCRFGRRATILMAKNFNKSSSPQCFLKEQTGVDGVFIVDHKKRTITYINRNEGKELAALKETATNCANFILEPLRAINLPEKVAVLKNPIGKA